MKTYVVSDWDPTLEYGGVFVVRAADRKHLKWILEANASGRRVTKYRREFLFACQHAVIADDLPSGIIARASW